MRKTIGITAARWGILTLLSIWAAAPGIALDDAPQPSPGGPYKLYHHRLSAAQVTAYGLKDEALTKEWFGYNFDPKHNRFNLDLLPVGTHVLVDQNRTPIYKTSCGKSADCATMLRGPSARASKLSTTATSLQMYTSGA